ncbi:phosphomevalonate kinase-like isoform X2 [Acanthaster planci]|uniref:Phosphomevalonate kinase n=1 Tax=Acanthaster planci TaxID=133434 RepID=A0A8B7Z5I5_ACAPL|nr:phosphomevalonate kinase-like isoform X2 [Acanthaster planci]
MKLKRKACRLGTDLCTILRLSGPLKHQYAKENNLDFNKLLDATSYKEEHRAKMISWGEEQRKKDPAYFCRLAIKSASPNHKVWIISDARRQTDVAFFKENYSKQTVTIRVTAEDSVRASRGFMYTKGIDDAESECDLDHGVTWDFIISNNGNIDVLEPQLAQIIDHIQEKLTYT